MNLLILKNKSFSFESEVELPNNFPVATYKGKKETNRDGHFLHLMGLEALQAGAEVPGRLGPVMWNWEDSATWGRLPPGWLYLKLALASQMG